MDTIMLCMKKRGIRFFSKIKFENIEVKRCYEKNRFLSMLNARIEEKDNVLVLAHGGSDAIVIPSSDLAQPYKKYIALSNCDSFKNDFVFAVSCLTANEFGQACIKSGAISYLGYQVEISDLFSWRKLSSKNVSKRIRINVSTIIKHVFIETLSDTYEEFITTPISVEVLRERFAFLFERRVSDLSQMNSDVIFEKYGVKIPDKFRDKYTVELISNTLSIWDSIVPRLICLGDKNYISSTFVTYYKKRGLTNDQIEKELDNSKCFAVATTECKEAILSYLTE